MRVEISALVREAAATTVYITHGQAEAFALADVVGVLDRGRLVQTGTPEEIYTRPATPFVARFTGLSGELPVTVLGEAGDGLLKVQPAGEAGIRPFHARAPAEPLPPGPAVLLIRPTGVRLCPPSDGEPDLAGTVADTAFRGRGYEHAIDLPGHGRLTGVFSGTRAARGERAGLRLDPAGCHVFAARPADPGGADEAVHPHPVSDGLAQALASDE